jgi:hypothetical protein
MRHYNATLLSFVPLVGWYRYRNLFQLVPASHKDPRPPYEEGHYPLQLEVSYDPQVWPERKSIVWHHDVWEHERYEFIKNKWSNKKNTPADGYYEGIQRNTKRERLPAIIFEVSCLLTLFTNHRIFEYNRKLKQYWFIPITGSRPEAEENPTASVWGQLGYMTSNNGSIEEFSNPGCDHAKMVPMKEYYAQWRDPRCCGPEYHLDLPDILDQLLDAYLSLENSQQKAFYAACHLYNQALDFYNNAPSLSLIAAVSAIEALIKSEQLNDGEKVTKCKECGAEPSVETCSCCGLPRHRVGSRFREFLKRYGSPQLKKFSDNLYKFRSSIAHTGELLREDFFDHGFYVGVDEKDEQEMFRRNALEVVRRTMLNWLLEHLSIRSNLV